MTRLCCGCLCCLSGKKRKSFPIHEKQRDTEVSKIFIRHVEAIRRTPPPPSPTVTNHQQNKKTKSKATIKNLEVKSSVQQQNDKSRLSNLFQISKQVKTPSPIPITTNDIIEDKHHSSSSWSSSTSSEVQPSKKSSKHRSCAEIYNLSKENKSQKNNVSSSKPSGKSKLVLENVRKMMKDQNIQHQHFNHSRQKESARL